MILRNTYSPWAEAAALPHLEIRREMPSRPGLLGEYLHHLAVVRLHPGMPRRQERSVLAHELRHVAHGDAVTACGRVNLRQEQRADRESSRLLVDLHDLADAMVLHGEQHTSAVAVELRVSLDVVRTRLHHLHPAERHLLTRRLAED